MAKLIKSRLLLAMVLATTVGGVRFRAATSVRTMSWQELMIQADFVAEVECTVAGGIVAKYKVLAIWKGTEKPGDEIRLEISPNVWEPQFPLALVGQRFVVAGYRNPPNIMMSTAMGPGVPLWWRQLDSKYRTPLFQGMTSITPGSEKQAAKIFGTDFDSVEAFGKAAAALLKEPAEVQEKMRLDSQIAYYFKDPDETALQALRVLHNSKTLEEALPALQKVSTPEADRLSRIVKGFMDDKKAATQPRPAAPPPPAVMPPTEAELQKAIAGLAIPDQLGDSLNLLMTARPASVVDFLLTWENPRKEWSDTNMGYVLGSFFGHACPAEGRKALLTRLTDAKDPEIRVAAAVYLAFDDLPDATLKLRDLAKLEGDPGAWAALTLVRRGDAPSMPRALEIFSTPGEGNMEGVPHRNFQKQLLVLLSNSAAASGVVQPPYDLQEEAIAERMKTWYAQNAAKLKLTDSWAEELTKARAD